MPVITRRYIHEVSKDGNLFFLLNGFNGALNRMADQVGGGLRAIALALATPHDNAQEVKQFAERIKKQVESLEAAAKSQQPKGE